MTQIKFPPLSAKNVSPSVNLPTGSLLLKYVHGIDETHWLCRAYLNTVELVLECVGNCS